MRKQRLFLKASSYWTSLSSLSGFVYYFLVLAEIKEKKIAELKYKKYIVTDIKLPEDIQQRNAEYSKRATRIAWLDEKVVESAFSVICSWYWKSTEEEGTPLHRHDYDEVLGFFGSGPQNPRDLNGEVEFWLADEKYILKESCNIAR